MSLSQKEPYPYRVKYTITYFEPKEPKIGQFVHPNAHPREDQILRQILKLEPNLEEAKYVAIWVELNQSNLGYKPYFGFDNPSIRAFVAQMSKFT